MSRPLYGPQNEDGTAPRRQELDLPEWHDGGWIPGAWLLSDPSGRPAVFCFCCRRQCPLPHHSYWPQQALLLQIGDVLPWRPPSWIPRAQSLPSGKWTGRSRATARATANRARARSSFGLPCGSNSRLHSPFRGGASTMRFAVRLRLGALAFASRRCRAVNIMFAINHTSRCVEQPWDAQR